MCAATVVFCLLLLVIIWLEYVHSTSGTTLPLFSDTLCSKYPLNVVNKERKQAWQYVCSLHVSK